MAVAIQQEIARSPESRYDHRLHGVLLVSQGLNCYHVGELLGHHPTTVQRWVHQFNRRGFAGLVEGERPGRPRRLDAHQWDQVAHDLRQSPRQWGYGQNLWDGKTLAYHLTQHYGLHLGTRQCQRLFHQLHFRRRKPRPVIAKADPAAQAAFKKTPQRGPRRRGGPLERG